MPLYPHQEEAVEWLLQHRRAGLFDEQGLGKTASAIVAANRLGAKRLLVVAPTVVLENWRSELAEWAPGRRVQVIASGSTPVATWADVLVTSHSLIRHPQINARLRGFDAVIVDECHAFCKPSARRTQALYLGADAIVRRAPVVWALSGTPMPNDPSELWAILAGLDPERLRLGGKLMSFVEWRNRFCVVAPAAGGVRLRITGTRNEAELRERLSGFGLRRRLAQVMSLPPLRFGTVALGIDNAAMAEIIRAFPEIAQLALQPDSAGRPVDDDNLLAALQALPSFSQWRRLCGLTKVGPALELLKAELDVDSHKIILGAVHVDVIERLRAGLEAFGVVAITGAVSAADRARRVHSFQTRPSVRVIILQLDAGGVGITLTAASHVVLVEQSPVPAVNSQLVSRAYRIGQKESVLVRSLALAGSVDDALAKILARKSAMLSTVNL